ncbi:hypothetical protein [Rothia uropygialis]|uniref:hypothetical protein n=1 Tax=Kocuria sp. 36 TaxID=1415402 RepID=UPI00101D93B5|nr:hypothetical protein [Kocuria sp. 36]
MTDENRFLSLALANWVAEFNSEAPWVLGLKKNYSLQMHESMAPAMDQAIDFRRTPEGLNEDRFLVSEQRRRVIDRIFEELAG